MNSKSKSRLHTRLHKGQLVAAALSCSWRESALPPLEISAAELHEVTPLLYGSGAAALGWWRIRETELEASPSAELLHQAYRLQALQSAIHEQKIEKVFMLLRQASVEAILVKGWAAAGLYPDASLRPYGDIDLCVRPEHFNRAEEVLSRPEASDCWIDLHQHFSELAERGIGELLARSRLIKLGDEQIRILSAEDHLALLCIHLLKHGAWRPLWLCDVGAAIESLPSDFDWRVCLGRDRKRSSWILCAIGLAHRLLNANLEGLPVTPRAKQLPGWLVENVLEQWATPFATNQAPTSHNAPIASYLRNPHGLLKDLRKRWPNPIIATISINGAFNDLPRLPYQLGNCGLRAGQFLFHLPARLQVDR
jgi:hypothetical protein